MHRLGSGPKARFCRRIGRVLGYPALASDKRYADVLRGYLRAETIGPLPFRCPPADGRYRVPEDLAPAAFRLG